MTRFGASSLLVFRRGETARYGYPQTRCVTVSKTSVCRYVEFVYEAREREENTIMVG